MINNSSKGFTLVELLVVISVIGILSGLTLGVLNSSGIRSKARDSQRKADMKKVQTALELYFADNRGYPKAVSWGKLPAVLVTAGYVDVLPNDPNNNAGSDPCGAIASAYLYITDDPFCGWAIGSCPLGSRYIVATRMEVPTSDDDSLCTSLKNWGNFAGCNPSAITYCYGVQNP